MDHLQPRFAPRSEQAAIRLDGAAELRDIVAEHFAEPTGFEEIALHIDDDERALGGLEKRIHMARLQC